MLSVSAGAVVGAQAPSAKPYRAAAGEVEAVRRAAMDYLEGFYEGDTAKLVRSVSPGVVKYGYFVKRGESAYSGEGMPFAEFMSYAKSVKANNRQAPPTAPKEVTVYDVLDQTAAVKVVAWWGSDYLHLAKEDGRWMIKHVIWQTAPKATP
ncbi:MAG TPA: nuclear transport factor 2 family protein [Gemmatimonadaceae bacterium]|nr:nuclear transport factor 2 family protein [Gemmatimonadaceae bacterium]